jgi:hypothetical protein
VGFVQEPLRSDRMEKQVKAKPRDQIFHVRYPFHYDLSGEQEKHFNADKNYRTRDFLS